MTTHLRQQPTPPRAKRPAPSARRTRLASPLRREQILDRAAELVVRGGLGGLTMKRIAEQVGFSEAAIYRHYPTRQRLVLGLMDRLDQLLLAPIQAIVADTADAPAERVARVLTHHLEVVLTHHSLPLLLLAEAAASGDPVLVDRMRGIFRPYRALLEALVRQVVAAQQRGRRTTTARGAAFTPQDYEWTRALPLLLLGVPATLAIQHRLDPDPATERCVVEHLGPWLIRALEDVSLTTQRRKK